MGCYITLRTILATWKVIQASNMLSKWNISTVDSLTFTSFFSACRNNGSQHSHNVLWFRNVNLSYNKFNNRKNQHYQTPEFVLMKKESCNSLHKGARICVIYVKYCKLCPIFSSLLEIKRSLTITVKAIYFVVFPMNVSSLEFNFGDFELLHYTAKSPCDI